MTLDEKAKRKARRNLRVTSAVVGSIDHVYGCARRQSKRELESTLAYWYDQIAEEYEAEVASLVSALNIKTEENRRLRRRAGIPSTAAMSIVEDEE